MVLLLLFIAALIVLLQIGLMAMVRKLVAQLEHERKRISALEDSLDKSVQPRELLHDTAAGTFRLIPDTPQPMPGDARERLAPALDSTSVTGSAVEIMASPQHDVPPVDISHPPIAPSQPTTQTSRPEHVQEELRAQMLELMQQLVQQGMSVRDIAARCGLSEAEAELMLSLQGTSR